MTAVAGFDWDEGNLAKCRKHGVAIDEIEGVFEHPHRIAPDIAHSNRETRHLAIGNVGGERMIFVAFTLRDRGGERRIRPIGACYMHRKEVEFYEKAFAQSGN